MWKDRWIGQLLKWIEKENKDWVDNEWMSMKSFISLYELKMKFGWKFFYVRKLVKFQ